MSFSRKNKNKKPSSDAMIDEISSSGSDPDIEAKNIRVKEEPQEESHHPISATDFRNAISILRSISQANANCILLANDLVNFIRTGNMPEGLTDERPSNKDDLEFKYNDKVTAPNNRYAETTSVTYVNLRGNDQTIAVPPEEVIDLLAGDMKIYFDLVNPVSIPKKYSYLDIHTVLKNKAIEENKISYGIVLLNYVTSSLTVNPEEYKGHHIVYYATPENVYFIDAQKLIHGVYITKGKDNPIFNRIDQAYNFAADAEALESGAPCMGSYCYVSTLGEVNLNPALKTAAATHKKEKRKHDKITPEVSDVKIKIEPKDEMEDEIEASSSSSSDKKVKLDNVAEEKERPDAVASLQSTLAPGKINQLFDLCNARPKLKTFETHYHFLKNTPQYFDNIYNFLKKNPQYINAISPKTGNNLLLTLAPLFEIRPEIDAITKLLEYLQTGMSAAVLTHPNNKGKTIIDEIVKLSAMHVHQFSWVKLQLISRCKDLGLTIPTRKKPEPYDLPTLFYDAVVQDDFTLSTPITGRLLHSLYQLPVALQNIVAEKLVSKHVINSQNTNGETPLITHISVRRIISDAKHDQWLSAIKILFSLGADLSLPNRSGIPLLQAVFHPDFLIQNTVTATEIINAAPHFDISLKGDGTQSLESLAWEAFNTFPARNRVDIFNKSFFDERVNIYLDLINALFNKGLEKNFNQNYLALIHNINEQVSKGHKITSVVTSSIILTALHRASKSNAVPDLLFTELESNAEHLLKKLDHLMIVYPASHWYKPDNADQTLKDLMQTDQHHYLLAIQSSPMHILHRVGNAYRELLSPAQAKSYVNLIDKNGLTPIQTLYQASEISFGEWYASLKMIVAAKPDNYFLSQLATQTTMSDSHRLSALVKLIMQNTADPIIRKTVREEFIRYVIPVTTEVKYYYDMYLVNLKESFELFFRLLDVNEKATHDNHMIIFISTVNFRVDNWSNLSAIKPAKNEHVADANRVKKQSLDYVRLMIESLTTLLKDDSVKNLHTHYTEYLNQLKAIHPDYKQSQSSANAGNPHQLFSSSSSSSSPVAKSEIASKIKPAK